MSMRPPVAEGEALGMSFRVAISSRPREPEHGHPDFEAYWTLANARYWHLVHSATMTREEQVRHDSTEVRNPVESARTVLAPYALAARTMPATGVDFRSRLPAADIPNVVIRRSRHNAWS